MNINCEIKQLPAQPSLSIRTTTSIDKISQTIGTAYGAIMQYIGSLGIQPSGAPYTLYHNMDMQNLDVEMGFPVAQAQAGKDNIQPAQIAAGKYVSCLYVGPYSEMAAVYEGINKWAVEHEVQFKGECYEIYYNDPAVTPPAELKTEILFPVKE